MIQALLILFGSLILLLWSSIGLAFAIELDLYEPSYSRKQRVLLWFLYGPLCWFIFIVTCVGKLVSIPLIKFGQYIWKALE